ncbi:MAG: type II toxin-antitoxin system HicA family toxin [Actinobacteria bacterium]|nr:type II toxin-antitoxin system HicA family toxin [Actinomycetota bacterium]MBU1944034.1 type II toxin-antitoxin system HicA family toxin [Actinomycetota bacterium]MBU2688530.1 type II toxin-antitoxin system HicA family toxin [Actinomycetota bacterium]
MTRLPIVSSKTMDRLLRKLGFASVRQKGSHVFYRHPDGRTTTLPSHPGRDLARPLLREVLREIELSVEQFNTELENL